MDWREQDMQTPPKSWYVMMKICMSFMGTTLGILSPSLNVLISKGVHVSIYQTNTQWIGVNKTCQYPQNGGVR